MSAGMPSLFISHGAPTLALGDTPAVDFVQRLGAQFPRPEAVVVASAHWTESAPVVTASAQPDTIHDFEGFPRELHEIEYAAPGAPAIAERVRDLLVAAGFDCRSDAERGLDHGAWVPLSLMYPEADVPVLQLALQPEDGPSHHYQLGRALRPLLDDGVLVLGSGALTHNLGEIRFDDENAAPPAWTVEFRDWMAGCLSGGDTPALLDYRARAPHAARNHPTEEHVLPLFVALGAAPDRVRGTNLHTSYSYGVLAMDIWRFG